jgi:hypothetical protein
MKQLISALALVTLIAAPALAQRFESPTATPESAQAAPRAGQNQAGANDPNAVIDKGKVIGRDPDPWIRNEIMRHSHSGWPD